MGGPPLQGRASEWAETKRKARAAGLRLVWQQLQRPALQSPGLSEPSNAQKPPHTSPANGAELTESPLSPRPQQCWFAALNHSDSPAAWDPSPPSLWA